MMTTKLTMFGNVDIWGLPKVAFLSSDKFSPSSVLKCYDWAVEMKKTNKCVLSGFLSKLEIDVLDILLTGTQPIVMVLARGMYDRVPPKLKSHVESGRLLLVSPFSPSCKQVTRDQAKLRNQLVIDNAAEIVFAHIYPGGMLAQLKIPKGTSLTVLDDSNMGVER